MEGTRDRPEGGSGEAAVYAHRPGPEGLTGAKGAVAWDSRRAGLLQRVQQPQRTCPFRLTHPGVRRTGCGRSSLAPKDTQRGPTCSVWSFRRKAEEDRGEPH